MKTQCCIVGGGPAADAGLPAGRGRCRGSCREARVNFLPDFRGEHGSSPRDDGDAVSSACSTIFLKLPQPQIHTFAGYFGTRGCRWWTLASCRCRRPFIAMMPQWDCPRFHRRARQGLAALQLLMHAEAKA